MPRRRFRLAEVDPLPFGAEAQRHGAASMRVPVSPFGWKFTTRRRRRAARGTAPLAGDLEFFVDDDRWRAEQKHRLGATSVSGNIGGLWNRRRCGARRLAESSTVSTADVSDAARTAALFGFAAPTILRNTRGPMDATVNLSGEFTSPRFVGSASTTGVDVPSIGRAPRSPQISTPRRSAINITNIDGTVGGAHVKGDYLADLVNSAAQRRARRSMLRRRSDLLTAMPDRLRLAGPLSGARHDRRHRRRARYFGHPRRQGDDTGGQPVDTLDAKARWLGDDVVVDALTLTQGAGFVDCEGPLFAQHQNLHGRCRKGRRY